VQPRRTVVELAEIEKLLYELRYELDNRPAWLHIPLQGLASLIGKPEGG
jgi:maltose alpha-D-glucosyltransferase/alpha-amylase